MNIREQIAKIMDSYNPECDRHPDGVQVNVTDVRMLELIANLEYRLARLELFTGMVVPDPLPASPRFDAGEVAQDMDGRARFIDGEVDYQGGGDGQALEEIY